MICEVYCCGTRFCVESGGCEVCERVVAVRGEGTPTAACDELILIDSSRQRVCVSVCGGAGVCVVGSVCRESGAEVCASTGEACLLQRDSLLHGGCGSSSPE